MASDVGVGDSETAVLTVSPADGTTSAALTVQSPSGAGYQVTATGGAFEPVTGSTDMQQLWTADQPVVYDQAGRWVLRWDVTGTGEGVEELEVYVVASPVAGGPTWLPGRSRVAAYVTHRTLARNPAAIISSQSTFAWTFDSTTTPQALTVDRLIADGAAWVGMRVTPLAETVEGVASVIVALYAAVAIERQFKADEQSLQRANDMEKTMYRLLDELVEANNAAQGTDDYGVDVAPVWSFAPPDLRYDSPNYW